MMTYEERKAIVDSLGKIANLRPEFSGPTRHADMATFISEMTKLGVLVGADMKWTP